MLFRSHTTHHLLLVNMGLTLIVVFLIFQIARSTTNHTNPTNTEIAPSLNQASLIDKLPAITKETTKVSGLIVPHHNLVKSQREKLFASVKDKAAPKTVILISPNHYESGRAAIQTNTQSWEITSGTIEPNTALINKLINLPSVAEEKESFANEHGIKLILQDIKNTFPGADIVPLIFKNATTAEEITALNNVLTKNCSNCLMIASVDFSHYQPALLAELHDDLTERALNNLDATELLTEAEVDSPPALALLAEWAKTQDTKQFVLQDHTNAGTMANDPDVETTTHFFGWYQTGEPTKSENAVTFAIGGDMMFDRMIAHSFLSKGFPKLFEKLGDRTFWGTDARIINLEGPVSDKPVPIDIQPTNMSFHFAPEAINGLTHLKINVASLANNHTNDAGPQGFALSKKLLKEAKIQSAGGPSAKDTAEVATIEGHNLKLVIIGVPAVFSTPDVTDIIKEHSQKPNTRVLVFPHWGLEYIYKHNSVQEKLAHSWIDAGANLVIGAHPHIIQDSELYKGKPIIYSIGNFVFDQTFSKETQQGLFISGKFTDTELQLFALPHQAVKYQPKLIIGQEKRTLLEKLYQPFTEQKKASSIGDTLIFPISD